jgi:hypothetical protein
MYLLIAAALITWIIAAIAQRIISAADRITREREAAHHRRRKTQLVLTTPGSAAP